MASDPENAPKSGNPSDPFFFAFANACAWGCLLELKMRLLADNTPSMKGLAHAPRLEDIETAIATTFAARLKPGDDQLLAKTRVLRNKVLHGNFSKAKETLVELGHAIPDGGVLGVDVSGPDVLGAVREGRRVPVSQTPTKESSIYGWLLEAGQSGLFGTAAAVFRSTTEIVDRLFEGE
jgi:hypothetical protein